MFAAGETAGDFTLAVVVAQRAGVDGGATFGAGVVGGGAGALGGPGVVDQGAQQTGSFRLGAAVVFGEPGLDRGLGDAGGAGPARSGGEHFEGIIGQPVLARYYRKMAGYLFTYMGRVGSGRVG